MTAIFRLPVSTIEVYEAEKFGRLPGYNDPVKPTPFCRNCMYWSLGEKGFGVCSNLNTIKSDLSYQLRSKIGYHSDSSKDVEAVRNMESNFNTWETHTCENHQPKP